MIWGALLLGTASLAVAAGWGLCHTLRLAPRHAAEQHRASAAERRSHHLLGLLERDRRRVARRLHNGPIQDLLAADMETHVASHLGIGPAAALDVAPVVRDLRAISEGFAPPTLPAFGLAAALAAYAARFETDHPGLLIDLDTRPLHGAAPEVELALFRIAQEALDNVVRHADASRVDISLTQSPEGISLDVCDDGLGWTASTDPDELAASGRFGRLAMEAHAESIGGILRVDRAPGSTCIHAAVPDARSRPHAHADPHPHRR